MARQRFARPGGDELAIARGDGTGERVHETRVTAAMAVGGVHRTRWSGGNQTLGTGEEVVDPNGLTVAGQLGAGAEEPGAAASGLAERGHSEYGRGGTGKFQRDYLVVNDVVVTGIDTPAVRAVPQCFVQGVGVKSSMTTLSGQRCSPRSSMPG